MQPGISSTKLSRKKMEPIPGGDGIGSEKPSDLGDGGRRPGLSEFYQGLREEETAAAANPCLLRSDTQ